MKLWKFQLIHYYLICLQAHVYIQSSHTWFLLVINKLYITNYELYIDILTNSAELLYFTNNLLLTWLHWTARIVSYLHKNCDLSVLTTFFVRQHLLNWPFCCSDDENVPNNFVNTSAETSNHLSHRCFVASRLWSRVGKMKAQWKVPFDQNQICRQS